MNVRNLVGRRGALKTIGAGIASIGTFVAVGRGEDEVEIVTETRGETPVVTKSVPRDWYEHERRVAEALTRVNERFLPSEAILGSAIVGSDETVEGKGVTQVEVAVAEGEASAVSIPASIEDVAIRTVSRRSNGVRLTESGGGCHNNDDYDRVRGGVLVYGDGDDDGAVDQRGTSGCPVRKDGTEYLLTANHLFLTGEPCEGNWDEGLYQYGDGDYFGEVHRYDQAEDWAIVAPVGDYEGTLVFDVKGARWTGGIASHATKIRLQEMIGDGTTVEKMGTTTGAETGVVESIEGTYSDDCIDFDGHGVRTDCNTAAGDSGGPTYARSESGDGLAMVSLSSARPDWVSKLYKECGEEVYGRTVGPACYRIANEGGIEFGS
ncbi:hypothetical protein [Halegenticoccus tardaugens]|uniref:hypothetical protein n=1 Tax=Halegenticoccus tardaugens TaxID=2071624 RepID=UPI00100BEA21|nr:hypothetical protein [Halegenticoccus tardaugens]